VLGQGSKQRAFARRSYCGSTPAFGRSEKPMTEHSFAHTYGVELLCDALPNIEKSKLLAGIGNRCPGVKPLDGNETSGLLAFVHEDHPVQLKDARIPAQTFIALADKPVKLDAFESALQQSWSFADARQVVSRARSAVLVTDLMSSGLEYHERLELFHNVLLGVLSVISCLAIHWQPSRHIINPNEFVSAANGDPAQLFFAGAVNVRLFNIANSPGEVVMDTLGLGALGLPDLQCHFHTLDEQSVATLLYNTAWYIFQHGDVIQDENTIEGLPSGAKWQCRHEEALVEPEREVLDINPGPRYAAGTRS